MHACLVIFGTQELKPIPVTDVHFRVVAAATMADPHEYNMSGVKVKFPHKAYPSQVG